VRIYLTTWWRSVVLHRRRLTVKSSVVVGCRCGLLRTRGRCPSLRQLGGGGRATSRQPQDESRRRRYGSRSSSCLATSLMTADCWSRLIVFADRRCLPCCRVYLPTLLLLLLLLQTSTTRAAASSSATASTQAYNIVSMCRVGVLVAMQFRDSLSGPNSYYTVSTKNEIREIWVVSAEMTCKTGQMSVRACVCPYVRGRAVSTFSKPPRLRDRWADVDEIWHLYSTGWETNF